MLQKILQKESALLEYLPLDRTSKAVIYPPRHHKEIIEKIFFESGIVIESILDHNFNTESTTTLSESITTCEKSRLTYSRMEVFNTADILCFESDFEILDEINIAKKKLCLEHTDILYLYLDLELPNTQILIEGCEMLGFFFSGVLPFGLRGRHAVILQYLNNIDIDFEKIKMYNPLAQELLSYIEKCKKGV